MKTFLIFALLTCYENLKDNFPPILPKAQSSQRVSLYGSGDFFKMEESVWKSIPEYEGFYEYDQFGNVRGLDRYIKGIRIGAMLIRGVNIKPQNAASAMRYLTVVLRKEGRQYNCAIHRLVWQYHNGPIPAKHDIHHIDTNRHNNRIENLACIPHRHHPTFNKKAAIKSSYTGVCFLKKENKWTANIIFNGKRYYLGSWNTESDAGDAYKNALHSIENGNPIVIRFQDRKKPRGGVYFTDNRWVPQFRKKIIGRFLTKEEGWLRLREYIKAQEDLDNERLRADETLQFEEV